MVHCVSHKHHTLDTSDNRVLSDDDDGAGLGVWVEVARRAAGWGEDSGRGAAVKISFARLTIVDQKNSQHMSLMLSPWCR